jgi:hypothetical protein
MLHSRTRNTRCRHLPNIASPPPHSLPPDLFLSPSFQLRQQYYRICFEVNMAYVYCYVTPSILLQIHQTANTHALLPGDMANNAFVSLLVTWKSEFVWSTLDRSISYAESCGRSSTKPIRTAYFLYRIVAHYVFRPILYIIELSFVHSILRRRLRERRVVR